MAWAWAGALSLDDHADVLRGARHTVLHDRHDGPLRVLASLYPEALAVCHNVLVHLPGGLVGGNALRTDTPMAEGTHALVTTPGATRYYRSTGAAATQPVKAVLAPGAGLEWPPLESLAYSGCLGSTLWFAAGAPLADARRTAQLDLARSVADAGPLRATAAATAPDDAVVVLRVLAPRVEPARALLAAVWAAWRGAAWQLGACVPRDWRT